MLEKLFFFLFGRIFAAENNIDFVFLCVYKISTRNLAVPIFLNLKKKKSLDRKIREMQDKNRDGRR
jgi:hypothetical protein